MFQSTFDTTKQFPILTVDASKNDVTRYWLQERGVEFRQYGCTDGSVKFTLIDAPQAIADKLNAKFNPTYTVIDTFTIEPEIIKTPSTTPQVYLEVWKDGYAKLTTPSLEISHKYVKQLESYDILIGGGLTEDNGENTILIWGLPDWTLERLESRSYVTVTKR